VIALELEKVLAEEAKKRQGERTDLQDNLCQKFDTSFEETDSEGKRRATQQAAKALGTNRQYVSDAKKLQKEAPELLEKVKTGKLTISNAKKQLKNRQTALPSQTVWAVGDVVQITFPPELRDMEEVQLFNHQVGTIVEKTTNGIGFIVEVDGKRTPPIPKHSLTPAQLPEPKNKKETEVQEELSEIDLINAIRSHANGDLQKAMLKVSKPMLKLILEELNKLGSSLTN
jgi:ribosomal protein L21E